MKDFLYATIFLFVHAACPAHGATPVAFTAKGVVTTAQSTQTLNIWSDGVHTRRELIVPHDESLNFYYDDIKRQVWIYGPTHACVQNRGETVTIPRGRLIGNEVIDGHPTAVFKEDTIVFQEGKGIPKSAFEWRATDLGNLVIQTRSFDGDQYNLRNIVVGAPVTKALEFPSSCKDDKTLYKPMHAGPAPKGFRIARFSDLTCRKLPPLDINAELPSDFQTREVDRFGCFSGTKDDLAQLKFDDDEIDFHGLKHGVFWVRESDTTKYDAYTKQFVSEMGPQEQWTEAMAQSGARDVDVKWEPFLGIPTIRVTATVDGKTARMFFFGFGDRRALRISYQSAGKDDDADAAAWQNFLDSFSRADRE